ncbi:MAG: transcriptional regulator [Colwellia sp.]|nr:transcriptional regulator [Colwellia sp.]
MYQENNTPIICRLPEILALLHISKSTLFNQINDGLLCSSINLGTRCKGYIWSEALSILNARITGQTDDQIKQLVIQLESNRGMEV